MTDASNVVRIDAYRKPPPEPARERCAVRVAVYPKQELQEGDMVAIQFRGSRQVMFTRWFGRTGRDCCGRFVKKGSPNEAFRLDLGLIYTARQAEPGGFVQILGAVLSGVRED